MRRIEGSAIVDILWLAGAMSWATRGELKVEEACRPASDLQVLTPYGTANSTTILAKFRSDPPELEY